MTKRCALITRVSTLAAAVLLWGSSAPLDATPEIELVRGRVQAGGADHLGAGSLSLDGTIGQHEVGAKPQAGRWLLLTGFQATDADPRLLLSDGFESGGTDAWSGVLP